MGKSRNSRSDKELSREQKLIHENRVLKRALAKLRKQLDRIDLDRYQEIKEIIDESHAAEMAVDEAQLTADLRKRWRCEDCGHGTLEIFLFQKIGETWYFRMCDMCPKRTRAQRYDAAKVSGIMKEKAEPIEEQRKKSFKPSNNR